MEAVIILLLVTAGAGVAVVHLVRTYYQRRRQRLDRQRAEAISEENARRRAEQEQIRRKKRYQKVNAQARHMQTALLQLDQSSDFRRAASWAAKAGDVPVSFRQRQFRRFRPKLVQHFATRLSQGTDEEVLIESLTELVKKLGVAPFEADYIQTEANQRQARNERRAGFGERVSLVQREHDSRVEAIRNLQDLDPELREQLIEAEEQRFRDSLLGERGAADTKFPSF